MKLYGIRETFFLFFYEKKMIVDAISSIVSFYLFHIFSNFIIISERWLQNKQCPSMVQYFLAEYLITSPLWSLRPPTLLVASLDAWVTPHSTARWSTSPRLRRQSGHSCRSAHCSGPHPSYSSVREVSVQSEYLVMLVESLFVMILELLTFLHAQIRQDNRR